MGVPVELRLVVVVGVPEPVGVCVGVPVPVPVPEPVGVPVSVPVGVLESDGHAPQSLGHFPHVS